MGFMNAAFPAPPLPFFFAPPAFFAAGFFDFAFALAIDPPDLVSVVPLSRGP